MWHGDIRLGDTVDVKFTTRSFSTGAPTSLLGTPTIAAYPNNSVTEVTAGITLTVDFDARTGLNNVRVVATGANGYLTATDYALVITTGTVGGVSVVGEVVGTFSIENRVINAAKIDTGAITSSKAPNLDAAVSSRAVAGDAMALTAAAINLIFDELTAEARVAGSYGQKLKDLVLTAAGRVDLGLWLGSAPNALVAGRPDVDVGAIATNPTAALNQERAAKAVYRGSVTAASTTTTIVDSALTQADTDFWKGRIVIFTMGALAFQATDITAFTPATDTLTVTALTQAPAIGDQYVVV